MRRIVLDTETTGLDHRTGDRVIEIGCVELVGRRITGENFHAYLNPGRPVADSEKIHGLSDEFLADKPAFAAVAGDFLDFIRGAELVIHNAAFDIGFLDNELALAGQAGLQAVHAGVIDTLKEAREKRPGKKNSLDALCRDFGVDNSERQLHGALRDAKLLAEVWLAMTRGQESLIMDLDLPVAGMAARRGGERPPLAVLRASEDELAAHRRVLDEIARESQGRCLWKALEAAS